MQLDSKETIFRTVLIFLLPFLKLFNFYRKCTRKSEGQRKTKLRQLLDFITFCPLKVATEVVSILGRRGEGEWEGKGNRLRVGSGTCDFGVRTSNTINLHQSISRRNGSLVQFI